jgi:hypothetical protein
MKSSLAETLPHGLPWFLQTSLTTLLDAAVSLYQISIAEHYKCLSIDLHEVSIDLDENSAFWSKSLRLMGRF